MPHKIVSKIASSREGKFYVERGNKSSFSYFLTIYSLPDSIKLHFPPVGKQGFLQDAEHIRGYFQKALEKF